jgi:hypothetical protein
MKKIATVTFNPLRKIGYAEDGRVTEFSINVTISQHIAHLRQEYYNSKFGIFELLV